MNAALLAALDAGATIVTPNRRLARALHRDFDLVQRGRDARAWPTPTILPYPQWLRWLWDETAAEPDNEAAVLLTPAQSALQWRQVVEADAQHMALFDGRGAAALAEEAWTLLHQWGVGGESWRAWASSEGVLDDPAVFARWAESYGARLRAADACDLALVPDLLARRAGWIAARLAPTVFAGFIEPTPQQGRLVAAFRGAGIELRHEDTLSELQASAWRTTAATPQEEIAAALAWARQRAATSFDARIGIVIGDLVARRDEVVTLATDILSPAAALPGATKRVPFEISLGPPLGAVPVVAAALDLIALLDGSLEIGRTAALLRSPYLAGAQSRWSARARAESEWIREGKREATLIDAIRALDRCSPELAARWRTFHDTRRAQRTASPREWSDAWRAWLVAAGWPGERTLDSAEYQARLAWERLLLEFVSLGAVAPRLSSAQALSTLQALAGEQRFQPEGGPAPIQILGVLEASGLGFDALWVAGLDAERWPSAPSPNPLIPLAWQRQHHMPHATAAREREYAEALTARFARASREVVFSSAAMIDDHPSSPSALILGYPEREAPAHRSVWAAMTRTATLESILDECAPPLDAGARAPGGAQIVVKQSDCPFQAFARYRLGARPWSLPADGLTPPERGRLVHAAFARFWSAVRDSRTLTFLDEGALSEHIGDAVERALGELPPPRWRALPALLRDGEARRLAQLLRAWLKIERGRAAFAVDAVEAPALLQLAAVEFSLKLDRIDRLTDGGIAILDYKTGPVERPRQWFEARPRSAQLGMYMLAQLELEARRPVRVVGYAELRPEAASAVGIAADAEAWPGLDGVEAAPGGSWTGLEAWWRSRLEALAEEIRAGHAAVAPRLNPSPCRNCGLQPLCRIESIRAMAPEDANDG